MHHSDKHLATVGMNPQPFGYEATEVTSVEYYETKMATPSDDS